MRAILVSVDYSDLLSITLPYNRHHFEDVCIVTAPRDEATQRVANEHGCAIHLTSAFYADGAFFNKWKALEEGLDAFGRHGWLCLMDSDVLWPRTIQVLPFGESLWIGHAQQGESGLPTMSPETMLLDRGQLCTPLRRMWNEWPTLFVLPKGGTVRRHPCVQLVPEKAGSKEGWCGNIPDERDWGCFPIHRNVNEWAGYSQIFHADDPVLGPPPWHEVDWLHAGGADSFFQAKWPAGRKVRPPWECLHLGPAGVNWMGRASPLVDGTALEGSKERLDAVDKIWTGRRRNREAGRDQFHGEKLI